MDAIIVPASFAAAWIIILALAALVIQAVINRSSWSSNMKRGVTIAIAVFLGTLYMVCTGAISAIPLPVQDAIVYWFIAVAGIVAVSQAVYGFFKPYLETLEAKTS